MALHYPGAPDLTVTLTDEVTGSGTGSIATTVQSSAIQNRVAVTPQSGDFLLISDISDSDKLKKVTAIDLISIAGSTTYVPYIGATQDVSLGVFNLLDSANDTSISPNSRMMYDSSGTSISLDWEQRRLQNGVITILDWQSCAMSDSSGMLSINWGPRQLVDSGGIIPSVDWENRYLYSAGNILVLDYDNLVFYDTATVGALNWQSRSLYDNAGNAVIDWSYGTGRILAANFSPLTDATFSLGGIGSSWLDANILVLNDSGGTFSISPNTREMQISGGITTLNWASTVLNDFVNILSVDWSYRTLVNYSGATVLNWADVSNTGEIFGGTGLYSMNLNAATLSNNVTNTLNWNTMTLIDSGSSNISVDWANRVLADSGAATTLDWQNFYLVYNGLVSLNWQTMAAFDTLGAGALNWDNRTTQDSSGANSINWQNRQLINSSGSVVQNWNSYETYDSGTVRSINWNNRSLYNSSNTLIAGWSGTSLVLAGQDNSSNGSLLYESTRKIIQSYVGGIKSVLAGVTFVQTATGTAANTVAETTISSTGQGTLTLPAAFLTVSKTIRIRGKGFHSSTASPTLNLKVKFGSTVLCSTGAHTHHNATNGYFDFECEITCRSIGASGTVFAQGIFTDATDHVSMGNTATTTIDTTTTQAITVTAQWSAASASNTISLTNLTVEVLN